MSGPAESGQLLGDGVWSWGSRRGEATGWRRELRFDHSLTEESLADSHGSFTMGGDGLEEVQARRDGWTLGRPVRLADGARWWLPRLSWSALVFRPELLTAISRTYDLADKASQLESDLKGHTMATAIYHSQLAQLGVKLLQLNYDLPEERWRQLLSFGVVVEMLQMTSVVSGLIADSLPAWMPFYLTSGQNGADNLLRN